MKFKRKYQGIEREVADMLCDGTRFGLSISALFRNWIEVMFHMFLDGEKGIDLALANMTISRDNTLALKEYFASLSLKLFQAMESNQKELIGRLFEDVSASSKLGQNFTPYHVAELMALMAYAPYPASKEIFTVNDPACGAGVMLLAFAKQLQEHELDKTLFVAQDLDILCAQMTAINMAMANLNAIVICGNSLTFEVFDAWAVKSQGRAFGSLIEEYPLDEAKRLLANPKKEKTSIATAHTMPVQLSLI